MPSDERSGERAVTYPLRVRAHRRPRRLWARVARLMSRRTLLVAVIAGWIIVNFAVFVFGVTIGHRGHPMMLNQAYSTGVEAITFHRFTPGYIGELLVLASILASIRWLMLKYLVTSGTGPVEIRPLANAAGDDVENLSELDVVFRDYLSLPGLYRVATIPGERDPDSFIEILRTPSNSGWRGVLAAAYAYAIPRRAFIVSATLRWRDRSPHFGVTTQIRRLPGLSAELETQWSSSFERALQRAAYAVGARILPQTRYCKDAPWTAWRDRELPVALFRSYQRAKRMVLERRYDEALSLYRQALLYDAGNVALRYDIGQLYERIGLYPDALYLYLRLVNEIFPPRKIYAHGPRRVATPHWRPGRMRDDPFVIRYRYVVSLGLGAPLVRELTVPAWDTLHQWTVRTDKDSDLSETELETRPQRVVELAELRRLLSNELSRLFPEQPGIVLKLAGRCQDQATKPADTLHAQEVLERYLLELAQHETSSLCADFRKAKLRSALALRPGAGSSALTLVAMRVLGLALEYRLQRLDCLASKDLLINPYAWQPTVAEIGTRLREVGYDSQTSTSWLEHYNAACIYALMLADDVTEVPAHQDYADAAVEVLERAQGFGEDIDFVRTKRYWLQAGDPDLVGLRRYRSFRAMEARTYRHAFPEHLNMAEYELYVHLRTVLESGAARLEKVWRDRCKKDPKRIGSIEFEEWWRREEHAWELAIRLGRFYPQWQTRSNTLDGLRNWIESFGTEAPSVPYPNISRIDYIPDLNELEHLEQVQEETRAIFHVLASECGTIGKAFIRNALRGLSAPYPEPSPGAGNPETILERTRAWTRYSEQCAHGAAESMPVALLTEVCTSRANLWAALRQWAKKPSAEHHQAFKAAAERLTEAPPTPAVG